MPRENKTAENKTLMRGVLLLMPAALLAKFVGLFYKIPLIRIVGVEGMAYFLSAYHVYSMLFVLSATGLPTALSLSVASAAATDGSRAVRRVFAVALALFLSVGFCGTALLYAFAAPLAARLAMKEAAAAITAIAPALFLSAFLGAAKGYFQGQSRMGPTALSEVLEAVGKLFFGLALALRAKKRGLPAPQVAAHAVFGITAGLAAAAVVLGVWLLVDLRRAARSSATGRVPPRRAVLASLLRVALPVTLGASVMSLVSLLDTALISRRLQAAGFAPSVANAMYSSYGNLAVPLYNLVPALLSPVTLALMPLLGAAAASGDGEGERAALRTAWRFVSLISIPAALGLAVFARPVLTLLYHGQTDAVAVAAPLLTLLALSVPFSAMLTLTGAALQAKGHALLPVAAMGAGAAVKLIAESLLLTSPRVGILGAPISTFACTLTVLTVEWIALARVLSFPVAAPRDLFRPLLAALPGVLLGMGVYFGLRYRVGEPLWLMPLALFVTVAAVGFLALFCRAVEKQDLLALPAGEKLCAFLEKRNLIK